MFNISNNNIVTINRGDTFTLNLFINDGTVLEPIQYFLQEGDKLYFGLMEANQPFEFALIRKVFTMEDAGEDGYVVMKFDGDMTEFLLPGTYYYMVKLYKAEDESVETVINKTKFVILD